MNSYFAAPFLPQYSAESHYMANGYGPSTTTNYGHYSSRFSDHVRGYQPTSNGAYGGVCAAGATGHHAGVSSLSESCASPYSSYHVQKSSGILHTSPYSGVSPVSGHHGNLGSPNDLTGSSGYPITPAHSHNSSIHHTPLLHEKYNNNNINSNKHGSTSASSATSYSHHHGLHHHGEPGNSNGLVTGHNSGNTGLTGAETPPLVNSHHHHITPTTNHHSQHHRPNHHTPQQQQQQQHHTQQQTPHTNSNHHATTNTNNAGPPSGGTTQHAALSSSNNSATTGANITSTTQRPQQNGYLGGYSSNLEWPSHGHSHISTPSPTRSQHSPFGSPGEPNALSSCSLSPKAGSDDLNNHQQPPGSANSSPEQPAPFYPWMGIVAHRFNQQLKHNTCQWKPLVLTKPLLFVESIKASHQDVKVFLIEYRMDCSSDGLRESRV
uniref:Uncharacterized protein n=1 Tax=Biomphalaria glabrata TaxID=6526 RepID=A0A2C9LMZ1_BIOGL